MASLLVSLLLSKISLVVFYSFRNEWKGLPNNLVGIEQCTFKIKRFSDSHEYIDISESLLSGGDRIHYLFDFLNDTVFPDSRFEHDFHYFEHCVVNFIVKYDGPADSYRRHLYIRHQRDSYRGNMFSTWIIVTRQNNPDNFKTYTSDYYSGYRTFYSFLPKLQLYYLCPYCKTRRVPLPNLSLKILEVNPFQFRSDWDQIHFHTSVPISSHCGGGWYEWFHCVPDTRTISSISKDLNITFSTLTQNAEYYGYYWHWIESTDYNYAQVSRITLRRTGDKSYLIYCNYQIRAEEVSFLVWVSPFRIPVWGLLAISFIAIVLISVLQVLISVKLASSITIEA